MNLPLFVQSATPVPEEIFCAQCDAPCGPPLSLGPDREFSSDTTVLLQAGSGYAAYLWQDGSTAPTLSAQPGSTVYWVEVRDVCGFVQRDTLRLTLNEAVCDHKDLSCIRWELLDVEPVAANSDELRYRVKLTNSCASALHYVCFQVPAGLTATYPLATYTAQPDGRDYAVRSPNYSPFYSLRFSAAGGSPLSSGSFDLFEYHMPAQAQPAYIGTTVRLEDGSTYSALLNTFRCPPSTAYDRSDAQSRRYLAGQPSLHL